MNHAINLIAASQSNLSAGNFKSSLTNENTDVLPHNSLSITISRAMDQNISKSKSQCPRSKNLRNASIYIYTLNCKTESRNVGA